MPPDLEVRIKNKTKQKTTTKKTGISEELLHRFEPKLLFHCRSSRKSYVKAANIYIYIYIYIYTYTYLLLKRILCGIL